MLPIQGRREDAIERINEGGNAGAVPSFERMEQLFFYGQTGDTGDGRETLWRISRRG